MKKAKVSESESRASDSDDLRPQYDFDFSKARPNRFASRLGSQRRAVTLDPDVAKVFTTAKSVNAVLRALIKSMPR